MNKAKNKGQREKEGGSGGGEPEGAHSRGPGENEKLGWTEIGEGGGVSGPTLLTRQTFRMLFLGLEREMTN